MGTQNGSKLEKLGFTLSVFNEPSVPFVLYITQTYLMFMYLVMLIINKELLYFPSPFLS